MSVFRPFVPTLSLLVLFGVSTYLLGQKAYNEEIGRYLEITPFHVGDYQFGLFFKGKCRGSMKLKVFEEDSNHVVILGEGQGQINYKNSDIQAKLSLHIGFNEIDQLTASSLTVEVKDTKVGVGTLGADPIEVRFVTKSAEQEFRHTITLPGPVELVRFSSQELRLKYPFLESVQLPLNTSRYPDIGELSLRQITTPCEVTEGEGLPLDPFLSSFSLLSPFFTSL